MRTMKWMGVMAIVLLAGQVRAQTNFIWIPYWHADNTYLWWTNASIPDEVTNWQGWQAMDENFRRASNAIYWNNQIASNALWQASQGTNGSLIGSNSWHNLPTLLAGDNFYTSSNGVPHATTCL